MSIDKNKSVALVLAAGPWGILGLDKFYVGQPELGVIQFVLSITIIGLFVSVPWAALSTIALLFVIYRGSSFMYGDVNWADTTDTDKIIGYIVIGLLIISALSGGAKRVNCFKRRRMEEEEEFK